MSSELSAVSSASGVEPVNKKAALAHMRHELRTPVNAIVGYSEMLLEDTANLAQQRFYSDLQHVHAIGKEVLALINENLDASRVEGEANDVNLAVLGQSVRLQLHRPTNELIDSCDLLLREAAELSLDDLIPDLQRIRAASQSLFTLSEAMADFGKQHGSALIEPTDLPTAATSEVPGAVQESAGTAPAEVTGHVLVVDDNAFNRDMLARGLHRQGHRFTLASNGRQALELAATGAFDLMLLDIMMPQMNGIQVLERLKADEKLRHMPVIMISALDEIDSVVRCIEMGADDFLNKPFNPVLLKARISACLEKKLLHDREQLYLEQIKKEQERSDALLHVILPDEVVEELKQTNSVRPRRYENVAVLFADIVGFTPFCDRHPPEEVVQHLQALVEAQESAALRYHVQKIKTIGDAFMAASGLLTQEENPVLNCVRCGLEMVATAQELPTHWNVRVGIHAGSVVAGVLGRRQYLFDLWGDTVNTAARMESHGVAGAITLSGAAWQQIASMCRGVSLGEINVKGKGKLEMVRFDGFL